MKIEPYKIMTEEWQQGIIEDATPAIHMNSSSANAIVEEWWKFGDALAKAMELFPHESFHPRNHYVKENGDKPAMVAAHSIRSILYKLQEIADAMPTKIDPTN